MTQNLWPETGQAHAWLAVADSIPHRREGEAAVDFSPAMLAAAKERFEAESDVPDVAVDAAPVA